MRTKIEREKEEKGRGRGRHGRPLAARPGWRGQRVVARLAWWRCPAAMKGRGRGGNEERCFGVRDEGDFRDGEDGIGEGDGDGGLDGVVVVIMVDMVVELRRR